jgi:predicted XRE-type DNA-binding protein
MRYAMATKSEKVQVGSGDVFSDLGFADAGERKLRVGLAMKTNEILAARKLAQADVAKLFGISQPHVSELKNYKLNRFSSERLMRFLTRLDRDVEVVIRPKARGRREGQLRVSVA